MAPISLDTSPAQTPISFTDDSPPTLPDDVASVRADKAQFGLKDKVNISPQDYLTSIQSGNEDGLRQKASADLNVQDVLDRNQRITDFVNARGGRPLSPEDMQSLANMAHVSDPNSVFEKNFSQQYIDTLKQKGLLDAPAEVVPQIQQDAQATQDYTEKGQLYNTYVENAAASAKGQSWIGWGVDIAKSMFAPYLYEWAKTHNLPGEGTLYTLTTEQIKALKPQIEQLSKDNPQLALSYLQYLKGVSTDKHNLDQILPALDVLTYPGLGALLGAPGKLLKLNEARVALKTAAEAVSEVNMGKLAAQVAEGAAGDLKSAAISEEALNIVKTLKPDASGAIQRTAGGWGPSRFDKTTTSDSVPSDAIKPVNSTTQGALDYVYGVFNAAARNLRVTPGGLGTEIINRVKEQTYGLRESIAQTIMETSQIQRIPAIEASQQAMKAIVDDFANKYQGINNRFLDVATISHDPATNTFWIESQLGRESGEFFTSAEEAGVVARKYGLEENTGQQGKGFYLSFVKPLDETSQVTRDLILGDVRAQTPVKSPLKTFLGWIRTPEDTLSEFQRRNRVAAVYAQSVYNGLAAGEAKYISRLSSGSASIPGTAKRQIWNDWSRAMNEVRDTGKFRTPDELKQLYQSTFERLPTDPEVEAYYAAQRLTDMQHVFENLNLYKSQIRRGAEHWAIDTGGLKSGYFAGRRVSDIEHGGQIVVVNPSTGKVNLRSGMSPDLKAKLGDSSWQAVEVLDKNAQGIKDLLDHVEGMPTSGFIDSKNIRYVVSPSFENKPLPFFQIDKDIGSFMGEADKLDPITAINRSLASTIRSTWFDDYKAFSVEHWLQEAKDLLVNGEDYAANPYGSFFKGQFKPDGVELADGSKMSPSIRARLEIARFHIKQLLGQKSVTQTALDEVSQKWLDSITGKYGANSIMQVGPWAWRHMLDPVKFVRAATFHSTIGLFAIPQFFVQSMTYVSIYGIEGAARAAPGSLGALLHIYSMFNDSVKTMEYLDKMASTLHIPGTSYWRPGEWLEANQELAKTGFMNVGSEHGLVDGAYSPKLISNGAAKFLDMGQIPFRLGEKNARIGAWYTAFRRFRDINPTAPLDNAARTGILLRARMLAGDMDRASKSMLQMGVGAFPFQFLGYTLRLAEQFMGKRLTRQEKLRLIATNAAIFGMPVASNLVVPVPPLSDIIKRHAIENGYQLGDNALIDTINNGLPAALGALVTGEWYNVKDRYGVSGLTNVTDSLTGDAKWWNILGGASANFVGGALQQMGGLTATAISLLRGEYKEHPIMIKDLLDPLRKVLSVNSAVRLYDALNLGVWMSLNENKLSDTDITALKATIMTLTGLSTQEVSDLNSVKYVLDARKESQQQTETAFIKEFRRGLRETDNPKQGQDYFHRSFQFLDARNYPIHDREKLLELAVRDQDDLVRRFKWQLLEEHVPTGQEQSSDEAYRRFAKRQRDIGGKF